VGKVAIVTDSTADIPSDLASRRGIRVVPCQVLFGDQVLRDRVDIQPPEFYRRLQESSALPTTSQPTTGDFLVAYRELNQWADRIVSIHLSQALSGTVAFARTAIGQLESHVPIYVVDSRLVSMAMGLVVLAAVDMADAGLDAAQIVGAVNALIPKVNTLFVVDTLEYLHRGGRIGGAEHFFGSLLSIKPLLEIAHGKVEALEKTRTKQRAAARLLEIVEERLDSARKVRFAVVHGAALQDALALKAEIEKRFHQPVPYVCDCSPVIGVHVGPGIFGTAFYIEEQ